MMTDGHTQRLWRDLPRLVWLQRAGVIALHSAVATGVVSAVGLCWASASAPETGIGGWSETAEWLCFAGSTLCFAGYMVLSGLQVSVARRVARSAGGAPVGQLVEAVAQAASWCPPELAAALTSALGHVGPADYGRLTEAQASAVGRILVASDRRLWGRLSGIRRDVCLQLAVLDMLRRCAGAECVPRVAYLARTGRDPHVRAAARDCLAYLQARIAEDRSAAALLRPAEPPGEATLLRPAPSAQETPREQLLRPANAAGSVPPRATDGP